MQREIKFRAYSPGNGWITGFNMVGFSNFHPKDLLEPHIYRYSTEWKLSDIILEQFTGLKDKNGIDIYEGDIVRVKGTKRIGEYTTTIIYKGCGFFLEQNKTYFVNDKAIGRSCEVIGNIHQHPELLTTD